MNLSPEDLDQLAEQAVAASQQAGILIAECRNRGVTVERKTNGAHLASRVVTEVDRRSQDLILRTLRPTCVEFELALLTEESEDDQSRLERDFFWCIDPLDGTLPFTRSIPGFSVSIALVARDGTPHIGVVYDPVQQTLYQAIKGKGAWRNGASWQPDATEHDLTLITGGSLPNHPRFAQLVEDLEVATKTLGLDGLRVIEGGGAVMNACWTLEQAPACTVKLPSSANSGGSLWDYSATACIFHEVGAPASDVNGRALDLNRADSTFMNHRGVLFASDATLAEYIKRSVASFG